MVAAVRRALFMDKKHATSVKEAIEITRPNAILILGTSVNMIHRIVSNLGLPPAEEIIKLRMSPQRRRYKLPVFPGGNRVCMLYRFLPLKYVRTFQDIYFTLCEFLDLLRGKENRDPGKNGYATYIQLHGKFYIADLALESIASYNACKIEGYIG